MNRTYSFRKKQGKKRTAQNTQLVPCPYRVSDPEKMFTSTWFSILPVEKS